MIHLGRLGTRWLGVMAINKFIFSVAPFATLMLTVKIYMGISLAVPDLWGAISAGHS